MLLTFSLSMSTCVYFSLPVCGAHTDYIIKIRFDWSTLIRALVCSSIDRRVVINHHVFCENSVLGVLYWCILSVLYSDLTISTGLSL